jgi:hypothetical protein
MAKLKDSDSAQEEMTVKTLQQCFVLDSLTGKLSC